MVAKSRMRHGIALALFGRRPPGHPVIGPGVLDRPHEIGVDRGHLVLGEHVLQQEEAGFGQEVGGLAAGSASSTEALVEIEGRTATEPRRDTSPGR